MVLGTYLGIELDRHLRVLDPNHGVIELDDLVSILVSPLNFASDTDLETRCLCCSSHGGGWDERMVCRPVAELLSQTRLP